MRYSLCSYSVFSLTWPLSMQIYWNKRKRLHKKRVQLPQDWFGTQTWPPFHCFGTQIWPPWRHVKTRNSFCAGTKTIPNTAFSITWPASMLIYWNKRTFLHKKRVQFPQGFFCIFMNFSFVMYYMFLHTDPYEHVGKIQKKQKRKLNIYTSQTHTITYW